MPESSSSVGSVIGQLPSSSVTTDKNMHLKLKFEDTSLCRYVPNWYNSFIVFAAEAEISGATIVSTRTEEGTNNVIVLY